MASTPAHSPSRNARTGFIFAGLAAAMLGLGYASVPLYRAFCQATGLNGTAKIAEGAQAPGGIAGKIVSVRFDSNVSSKLPWTFRPEEVSHRVAIGARQLAFFEATNTSDRPITGRATFNITPDQAGKYFVKVQCFCFNEQTLKPGEHVRMPVTYYVDPALATDPDTRNISEITLSYTFFPVDSAKAGG